MANKKAVRNNNVQGTLSSTMNSTGTTMNSAGLANLEAISSTEFATITIDPGRTNGAPEIVYVTAHTGAATSATISRAQEGTAARAHSSTEDWVHAPTANDFTFRPIARVHRDAVYAIPDSAWTAIPFDTEDIDYDAMWSSTANTKLIAKTPGKYLVTFCGGNASTAGNIRGWGIRYNTTSGGPNKAQNNLAWDINSGVSHTFTGSDVINMSTGQFVQLAAYQNSGGTLNTSTNDIVSLSMVWLAH